MTPVRPPFTPPTPQPQGGARADAPRANAQRAFFQAAMGQAQAPARPAAPPTEAAPSAAPTTQRIPDPRAEPPTRILRPGSLLDIKV